MEEELTALIKVVLDEYRKYRFTKYPRQVNLSAFNSFYTDVKERFSEPCELLGLHHFFGGTLDDFFFSESKQWDEETLLKYGSPSPIRLDVMGETYFCHQWWIYYNGKHYDAECPTGVENLFDLPFIKEQIDETFNRPIDFSVFHPDL